MGASLVAELSGALYAPQSIALVGASADPLKASSRPLGFLRSAGYAGAVYPINRKGTALGDERVYRSLADLPEAPEHAFIMTPTAAVLDAVSECGRAGVKVATILSGGFAEVGEQGAQLQQRVLETADSLGIRLLGPNSLGIVNLHNGFRLTANAAFAEPDVPLGGLFAASQSGSMIGALLSRGAARGIGFSRLVSVGAEMDLSIGELCAATLDDPDVTGYLLFLETIRHSASLRQFAQAAAERSKPVIAYKLGRSDMAAQMAASHTGALAGEDDVATAFLDDLGIARVHTLDALIEAAPLLAQTPTRQGGRARRVGVVTTTGGGAAMVVDQLGVAGIEVVAPTPETLGKMLDRGATSEPGLITDLTLAGARPEIMRAALEVLTHAPEFDLILAVAGSSARHTPELVVEPIVEVARQGTGHAIAAFLVPDAPVALAMLAAAGVPSFRTPEACADAIAAALNRRPPRASTPPAPAVAAPTRLADEAESYRLLTQIGVAVAPHQVLSLPECATGDPNVALGYPVAVKALSSQLAHKSDAGGVVLGVDTAQAVGLTAERIRAAVADRAGVHIDHVLVQQMSTGIGEVLIGYRIDPVCGPLIMVAAGGTLTELYADRSIRLAPVDVPTAHEMLHEVTGITALRGFRGAPPGDIDALAEAVARVSQLAFRTEVIEAEINPLLVGPQGQGVVAVDAAVRFAAASEGGTSTHRKGHIGAA